MNNKVTLELAKEVDVKLKKEYKFGTKACPDWFKNTSICMEQDGSYNVSINIPSWSSMTEEEKNKFFEPFEGIRIRLRIVTPSTYIQEKKKNVEK